MEGPRRFRPSSTLHHVRRASTDGAAFARCWQPATRRAALTGRIVVRATTCAQGCVRSKRHQYGWAYSTMSQLGYMFLAVGCGCVRRRRVPHDHATRSLMGLVSSQRPCSNPRLHDEADLKRVGRGLRKYCPVSWFVSSRLAGNGGGLGVARSGRKTKPYLRVGKPTKAFMRWFSHRSAHCLLT